MVLSVDYRLSHEACHPGQLLDALAGYAHLIHDAKVDPSRIVIMGACAGGHLALMLARYLHDMKVLPMPAGIMLFSPWVDLVIDGEIEKGKVAPRPNTAIDLLSTSFLANLKFLGHHSQELLSLPLLSANLAPAGSHIDYPPTFISVGECEAWRRENEQLRDLMIQDGVDVTFDVQEDAVHDFWGFGNMVPSAKARTQVARNVTEWVSSLSGTMG
jgi:acetyl esterase/lipase